MSELPTQARARIYASFHNFGDGWKIMTWTQRQPGFNCYLIEVDVPDTEVGKTVRARVIGPADE